MASESQAFQTLRRTLEHAVHGVRHLTESTFVVQFNRNDLQFTAGQHISVGPQSDVHMREYSIYSGTGDDFLEILVKEIPEGMVSPALKKLTKDDVIKVEGPFGFFTINEDEQKAPLYFIATGTGIAPFHCFARSYPTLSFTILHGIRSVNERYEHETFTTHTYVPCISSKASNASAPTQAPHYFGRVTSYMRQTEIDPQGVYFLCGNCDMIYEVFDILQSAGVSSERIKAEVYF